MKLKTGLFVFMAILLSGCGGGSSSSSGSESSESSNASDFAGRWVGPVSPPAITLTLNLSQSGNTVSGDVNALGQRISTLSGTVNGDVATMTDSEGDRFEMRLTGANTADLTITGSGQRADGSLTRQ